jgi:ComF family protein
LISRTMRAAVPSGACTLYALGAYDGALRSGILNLKFRNCEAAARTLGRLLGRKLPRMPWVVVPVPLHAFRLRERGYNQAEAIAEGVVEGCTAPGSDLQQALVRVRSTDAQSSLPLRRRHANVRGAFAVSGDVRLDPARPVLLVDDVVTTGSTIAACSRVLRAAGARNLAAAALALRF